MTAIDDPSRHIADLVKTLPDWSDRRIKVEPAFAVMASPSWRGVDGAPWRVADADGAGSLFVKVMDAEASLYIDLPVAFAAAASAGELGIGPKVHLADVSSGLLVMEDLGEGWRVGGLEDLADPAIVDKALAARRAFQAGPLLGRSEDVFASIETIYEKAVDAGAGLPADIAFLIDALRSVADAVRAAAAPAVPIHGDANVSNVMISDSGEVRLVDFDLAGNGDPMADLGIFLQEAFAFEPEARDCFARFNGAFDERDFNRAMLYGIADDLRWGLLATYLAKVSQRGHMEFQKFGNWRLLRCRLAIRDPRFSERARRV